MSPLPYADADIAQLQRDADDCLLTYGTAFHPEIITSTDGINMETASGHRMMDVRHYRPGENCELNTKRRL
jgi:hypothetical protein